MGLLDLDGGTGPAQRHGKRARRFPSEGPPATDAPRRRLVSATEMYGCGKRLRVRRSASLFREHHAEESLLADLEPFRPRVELLGPERFQDRLKGDRRLERGAGSPRRIARQTGGH